MTGGINAPGRPQYEGQVVKFKAPTFNVWLYDVAKRNPKYGNLEWWAISEPTEEQQVNAMEAV